MPSSSDKYVSAKDIDPSNMDLILTPKTAIEYRKQALKKKSHPEPLVYRMTDGKPTLVINEMVVSLPIDGFESWLCGILFRNGKPVRKIFYRQAILKRWDPDTNHYSLRTVSDAARRLNDRIRRDTNFKEPLVSPSGKLIGLNPFYLS